MIRFIFLAVIWVVCFVTTFTILSFGPDIASVNIQEICDPGYARAHRPTEAYTWAIKRALVLKASIDRKTWGSPRDYELDHIIPICLGGSPDHLSNMQLQPWWLAKIKDKVEWDACAALCRGDIDLIQAQNFFRNWRE